MGYRKFNSIMEEMRFMYAQNYYPLIKKIVKQTPYYNRYDIFARSIQGDKGVLNFLFNWSNTPQGHYYWEKIYFDHYKRRY